MTGINNNNPGIFIAFGKVTTEKIFIRYRRGMFLCLYAEGQGRVAFGAILRYCVFYENTI